MVVVDPALGAVVVVLTVVVDEAPGRPVVVVVGRRHRRTGGGGRRGGRRRGRRHENILHAGAAAVVAEDGGQRFPGSELDGRHEQQCQQKDDGGRPRNGLPAVSPPKRTGDTPWPPAHSPRREGNGLESLRGRSVGDGGHLQPVTFSRLSHRRLHGGRPIVGCLGAGRRRGGLRGNRTVAHRGLRLAAGLRAAEPPEQRRVGRPHHDLFHGLVPTFDRLADERRAHRGDDRPDRHSDDRSLDSERRRDQRGQHRAYGGREDLPNRELHFETKLVPREGEHRA